MDVWQHLPLEKLVRLESGEKDAAWSKRLRIVILSIDRYTAPAIAMSVGLSQRICQRWVAPYNAEGLEGLEGRRGQDSEPTLTPEQEQHDCERPGEEPRPEDRVCSLRAVGVCSGFWPWSLEFRVQRSQSANPGLSHRSPPT
jgi:transposase